MVKPHHLFDLQIITKKNIFKKELFSSLFHCFFRPFSRNSNTFSTKKQWFVFFSDNMG